MVNLYLSSGSVRGQRFGVFLIFRVFFVLCGIDFVLFLAMLVSDVTTRPVRKISLWPYLLFAVVVVMLLLLPVLLIGGMWDFREWFRRL